MRQSWFHHPDCTAAEADELMAQYRRRGIEVERSLNTDLLTWTVSAKLPEGKQAARPSSRWQNRMWG